MNQISFFDGTQPFRNNKPIRLIELFAGYGSQALALKYLGVPFEHWCLSEWAVKSIQAYKDMHNHDDRTDYSKELTVEQVREWLYGRISSDYNTPMTNEQINRLSEKQVRTIYNNMRASHNVGSITQITAADLNVVDTDKFTYILTYSFPCVPAGTMIKTLDGYKPIESVNVGDFVLTHKNRYKKVLKTMTRISNHINHIKANGIADLQITDEHPLYVLRNGETQWIKSKDLRQTDLMSFNIGKNKGVSRCDNKILWLLGRYVADGHINKYTYNSVNFAIGFDKEQAFLDNIPDDLKSQFKKFEKKGCYDYRIADSEFQEACMEFGTGALNKEIPQWIFDLSNDKKKIFLDGYFSGDGHIRQVRRQTLFCTVSHKLFLGLQQLIIDIYGTVCGLYMRRDSRKETYNDTYNGQFTIGLQRQDQKIIGDKIFVPIREISREEKQVQVFNIEVEEDNSYTCENTIVHNCQDLSQAGQGKGMTKDSGTRSGLLWEVERLLTEMTEKPQILLMENVPQVVGSTGIKDFAKWIERLERFGYKNYWQCLNAKDYGIPQNRNRCFMVSLLGDYFYSFPNPMKLQVRLKDFLDKKVDEKYYLSDKTVEMFIEHTKKQQAKGNGFKFEPSDGGGIGKAITTRAGARTDDNFIIEQGNAVRENNGSRGNLNGERLQGLRQSSNECSSGSCGADGVLLGKTPNFQRGPLKDISRAILTDGQVGVVEWKK